MISIHEGKNSASLKEIWLAIAAGATVPEVPTGSLELSEDITGASWEQLQVLPSSASWVENEIPGEHGPVYEAAVSAMQNKDRLDLAAALLPYKNRRLLVVIKDQNDVVRLLVNARLTNNTNKDRQLASPNLVPIAISCANSFPAWYYTGAYPTE